MADGPLIVDIKRNSLDDGPGIRSVVFFKGCPLRCVWCQNPETLSARPQLQRMPERCVECGACVPVCERDVARPAPEPQSPDGCQTCGACVTACRPSARRVAGVRREVEELAELLLRDEPFYRHSGGGVTFSGGEPTLHPRFAGELASRLRERGVHVLIETCGHFDREAFEEHLLPHVSAIYFDLKLADDETHRQLTGRGNRRIRDNLRWLAEAGEVEILPRVPLVPGITDQPDNLVALAVMLRDLDQRRVALLPYNPLWVPKRRALGLDLPFSHGEWMPSEQVDRCAEVFVAAGLEVAR